MTSAARGSWWQHALVFALQMRFLALQPSIVSQTACIDAWYQGSAWERCQQIFSSVTSVSSGRHQGLEVDLVASTGLIYALEKGFQWLLAMHLVSHVRSAGLLPDIILRNSAISACEKCGMWSIGLIALSTCTACSTLADVISLTACISACEKSRHWRMGIGLLLTMRSSSLQPNIISCNSVLSACEKAGAWQQSFSIAEKWADNAVTSVSLDIISFTALLSAARTRWARAAVVLSKVRSESLRPDMGCCHAFALGLDTGTCWLQAVLLLEWMWSSAVLANQVIFTSLLSASNKCQQWQTSLNLYAAMSSIMVRSDAAIYEAVGRACSHWQIAQLSLRAARDAGLEPATESFAGAWPLALGWKRVDASAGNAALPFLRWQSVLEFLHHIQQPDATSYSIATTCCKHQRCETELLHLACLKAMESLQQSAASTNAD